LDFIERSAGELQEEKSLPIAHFATGLEPILKARLFAEHWTLIAEELTVPALALRAARRVRR